MNSENPIHTTNCDFLIKIDVDSLEDHFSISLQNRDFIEKHFILMWKCKIFPKNFSLKLFFEKSLSQLFKLMNR